jgi:hypothetical protein
VGDWSRNCEEVEKKESKGKKNQEGGNTKCHAKEKKKQELESHQ